MASLSPVSSSGDHHTLPLSRIKRAGTAIASVRCVLNFNDLGAADSTPASSQSPRYSDLSLLTDYSPTHLTRSWDSDDSLSDSFPTYSRKSSTSSSSSTSNSSSSINSLSSSISSAAVTSTIATSLLSPRKRSASPSDGLRRLSLSPSFHLPLDIPSKRGRREEDERKEETRDMKENRFVEETIKNIKNDSVEYASQKNEETEESQIVPVLKFGGISYPLTIFSDAGEMNRLWKFTTDVDILIKGELLNTAGLIIKTPREFKKGDQHKLKDKRSNFKTELRQTIKTFRCFNDPSMIKKLKELGLRVSNYYFTPLDTDPTTGEQRAFWIVNRMAEGVQLEWEQDPTASIVKPMARFEDLTSKGKKLLEVIRNIFSYLLKNTYNFETDPICRLDFHKGNFMFDLDGEVCYVDGNLRWDIDNERDLISEIITWFKRWCANNSEISRYLLADMMTTTWFKEWIANYPHQGRALLVNVITTPWFQEWIANHPEISMHFRSSVEE